MIRIEKRYIGPQEAEALLATTAVNRRISPARVLTLANEMRCGKWQMNGETIKISTSGRLLDGQHRLHGVIESDCTLEMLIAFGMEDESFETIDTGRARSGGDIIEMGGFRYGSIVAASAAMVWRLYHGTAINDVCVPMFALRVAERFPAIAKWAPFVGTSNARYIMPATCLMTALVYFDDVAKRPELAEQFLRGMAIGDGLAEGSPILALRNRMISMRAEGKVMNSMTCWAATARAVTALESGEGLTRIHAEKSSGAVRRPKRWDEHVKTLPKSMWLDDLRVAAHSSGHTNERITKRVHEVRAKAPDAKTAVPVVHAHT